MLVVDKFRIKYKRNKVEQHIINPLQEKHDMAQYCIGGLYSGITMKWDYKACILNISIPVYIKEPLHKFQHPTPDIPQHSPHQCNTPKYGSMALKMSNYTE